MGKKGRYLKNSDISYLGRYLPFITGILGIVLYRIALMKDYLFLYTDDDQALMRGGYYEILVDVPRAFTER